MPDGSAGVLKGLRCRDYERVRRDPCPRPLIYPPRRSYGRRRPRAGAAPVNFKELCERHLQGYGLPMGLVLDGKRPEDDLMVIAPRHRREAGRRRSRWGLFMPSIRERVGVDSTFLRQFLEPGMRSEAGPLCVIDGSKGHFGTSDFRLDVPAHAGRGSDMLSGISARACSATCVLAGRGASGGQLQAAYDDAHLRGDQGVAQLRHLAKSLS